MESPSARRIAELKMVKAVVNNQHGSSDAQRYATETPVGRPYGSHHPPIGGRSHMDDVACLLLYTTEREL